MCYFGASCPIWFLALIYLSGDVDGSGQLDFDEVHKLLEQLHNDMDPLPKNIPTMGSNHINLVGLNTVSNTVVLILMCPNTTIWWDCWDIKSQWLDSGTLGSQILRMLDPGRRSFGRSETGGVQLMLRVYQRNCLQPCVAEISMCNGKHTIFLEVSSPNLQHQNMDPQNCHAWRWKFLGQTKIAGYIYIYIYIIFIYMECMVLICNMGAFPAQQVATKDLPRPNRDMVESLMKRFDTSGKKTLNVKDFFECLRLQLLDVGWWWWWVKRFVYHHSFKKERRGGFNQFYSHPKSWRTWNPFSLSLLCWTGWAHQPIILFEEGKIRFSELHSYTYPITDASPRSLHFPEVLV